MRNRSEVEILKKIQFYFLPQINIFVLFLFFFFLYLEFWSAKVDSPCNSWFKKKKKRGKIYFDENKEFQPWPCFRQKNEISRKLVKKKYLRFLLFFEIPKKMRIESFPKTWMTKDRKLRKKSLRSFNTVFLSNRSQWQAAFASEVEEKKVCSVHFFPPFSLFFAVSFKKTKDS